MKDDGGPAYPFTPQAQQQLADGTWDQSYDSGDSGMSLRDHFAGMALSGMYAAGVALPHALKLLDGDVRAATAVIANGCYVQADAMLAERAKRSDDDGEETQAGD